VRTTVIVTGGGRDFPPHRHEYIREYTATADRIVAADSGADICLRLGIRPDVIVGDLDSISPRARQVFLTPSECVDGVGTLPPVELLEFPVMKDQTDTHLALEYALDFRPPPDRVIVCGAFGSRLDHMLATVLLLPRTDETGVEVRLVDAVNEAYILPHGESAVPGEEGDTFSLIPLTPEVTGITLRGFLYPLERATLTWGSTLGVSNQLQVPPGVVEIAGKGKLLAVRIKGEPPPY